MFFKNRELCILLDCWRSREANLEEIHETSRKINIDSCLSLVLQVLHISASKCGYFKVMEAFCIHKIPKIYGFFQNSWSSRFPTPWKMAERTRFFQVIIFDRKILAGSKTKIFSIHVYWNEKTEIILQNCGVYNLIQIYITVTYRLSYWEISLYI